MRFSVSYLKSYCEKLMTVRGVDPDCAETVADMLLDAELTGVGTHGVSRMAIYLERLERGLVSRHNEARITRETALARWGQGSPWRPASARRGRRAAASRR